MKVYIDLVLIINFLIDLLILISVKVILKRDTNLFRLLLSSFIGSLTLIFLFINISNLILFLIKLIISIIMNIIAFKYKDIRYLFKNIIFFYINSIVIGGFIYFVKIQFKNINIFFYLVLILFLSSIIIYVYIKQLKDLKTNYNNYYEITIYFIDNKIKKYIGYLDTGNKIKDPITKKPIILLNYFNNDYPKLLVPCNTVNKIDLLECFKVNKVFINNKYIKNVLIGLSKNKINIDGVDCILNPLLLEERI